MVHPKSCEMALAVKTTEELLKGLEDLRLAWKDKPSSVAKGLSCSESKEGQFILVAAESAFVTLPGACVIKGIGAIELLGAAPAFEEGAKSKTLDRQGNTGRLEVFCEVRATDCSRAKCQTADTVN
jgi:hypothetical protein